MAEMGRGVFYAVLALAEWLINRRTVGRDVFYDVRAKAI
jgi:hypothetical protein